MLELVKPSKKHSQSKESRSKLSLVEIIKKDPDLLNFFKLVHEEDMREKAYEEIKKRISKSR